VEGVKFKLRICFRGLHLQLSLLLRTRSAKRLSSQHFAGVPTPRASAELVPSVFVSVHNNGFCSDPNTSSQEKHLCLSQHSNLRNSRNLELESSRSTSLEFVAFGSDVKHSRDSALRYFLSTTMDFAAVRTHFPTKKHPLLF